MKRTPHGVFLFILNFVSSRYLHGLLWKIYPMSVERKVTEMAFNVSFYISRTAVEILALTVVTAAGIYIVNDLMDKEEPAPVINPIEG